MSGCSSVRGWVVGWMAAALLAACGGGEPSPAAEGPGGPLTPADHDALFFPITTGVHQAECAACHPGESFSPVLCTGCHERDRSYAAHFSITENFVYADASCLACHPRGGEPRFDHEPYFPIRGEAVHAGTPCIDCHQNTADRHQVECLDCHPPDPTDAQHVDVRQGANGYEQVAASCVRCHPDAGVLRVEEHLPFHIGPGFAHYRRGCIQCHTSMDPRRPWAIDYTRYECLECHPREEVDPIHSGKETYRFDNVTCLSVGCHAQGTRND